MGGVETNKSSLVTPLLHGMLPCRNTFHSHVAVMSMVVTLSVMFVIGAWSQTIMSSAGKPS